MWWFLVGHGHECRRTAKKLKSREHPDALPYRHIVVLVAMQEKKWRMDLVGIVERTLLHVKVGVAPGIGFRHRHLTVGIAPVALTPIARMVAYA